MPARPRRSFPRRVCFAAALPLLLVLQMCSCLLFLVSLLALLLRVKCVLDMQHSGRSAGMASKYGDTVMGSRSSRVACTLSICVLSSVSLSSLPLWPGCSGVGGAHGRAHGHFCSLFFFGLFARVRFSFCVHCLASHQLVVWPLFSFFSCSSARVLLRVLVAFAPSRRCVRRGVVLRRVLPFRLPRCGGASVLFRRGVRVCVRACKRCLCWLSSTGGEVEVRGTSAHTHTHNTPRVRL